VQDRLGSLPASQPILPPLERGNPPDNQGGPAGSRYAPDSRVWGLCDRCGFRYKLSELRYQIFNQMLTGWRVCPECYDDDDPQLQLGRMHFDDVGAPRDARPDTPVHTAAVETQPLRWAQPVGVYFGVFILSTSTWTDQPRTLRDVLLDGAPGVLQPNATPYR
jgi:hypothetical protein